MRKMMDSGLDIVGQMPNEWNFVRLRYLCNITTGNSDTQDADPDGEYLFYVRSPIIERSTKYTFDGEGILMAGDGAGAGRVFHHAFGKYAVHQRVYRLYNFKINSNFLFYYVSNLFPSVMDKGSAQSTVPSVRLPMLLNFEVCFPPIAEQQRIADFLDEKCGEFDSIRSDMQREIEILNDYKKSVITEAVTKGLNPKVKLKDSGIEWIGKIPEHWDVHPLYYYFGERKHKNVLGEEKNLLSISYGKIIRKNIDSKEGLLPENFNGYNIIEKDDIVMRLTDLQNDKRSLRTGLVKEHGIITSAYVTLKAKRDLSAVYFHYLLHCYDLLKVLYNMGNGVRQGLNFSELSRMMLIEPSIVEQKAIAVFLDEKCSEIDATIADKQKQLETLDEYKKSLIFEYVTGKKEVS